MEFTLDRYWPHKRRIFPGNQVVVTDGEIDANTIAFERAVEKVQNKLSLPEYKLAEEEIQLCNEEVSHIEQYKNDNSDIQQERSIDCESEKKQTTLDVMWHKWNNPNYSQHENDSISSCSSMEVCPINSTPKKFNSLKQMTLDDYRIQENVLKSETPCSWMISCCRSVSNNNHHTFIHQKLLWKDTRNLFSSENVSLPFLNQNINLLGIIPKVKCKSEYTSRDVLIENRMPSQVPCLENEINPEEVTEKEIQRYKWIDNDSLEINIDEAMLKYNINEEPSPSFTECGVQTTPPIVHACSCLEYHKCEAFLGLTNRKCVKKREVEALDLDTLNWVPRKKNAYSYDKKYCESGDCLIDTKKSSFDFSDQEVPQQEMCANEKNDLLNIVPHQNDSSTTTKSLSACLDNNKCNQSQSARLQKSCTCTNMGGSYKCEMCSRHQYFPIHGEIDEKPTNNSFHVLDTKYRRNTESSSGITDSDLYNDNNMQPIQNESECNLESCAQKPLKFSSILNYTAEHIHQSGHQKGVSINSLIYSNNSTEITDLQSDPKKCIPKHVKDNCMNHNEGYKDEINQDVPEKIYNVMSVHDEEIDFQTVTEHPNGVFPWSPLQKPFEEFLSLKAIPQKVRRIGLSRRDRPATLHSKRKQPQ